MKASQARVITENSVPNFEKVYSQIEIAAREGYSRIKYDLSSREQRFASFLIQKLKSDGYTVKREEGCDQRDDYSWDYLSISW